jgi:hypothetical protein
MWPDRIAKVRTGRRVLKRKLGTPRSVWRASIASVLKKFQLELKEIQQVTLVFCHEPPRRIRIAGRTLGLRCRRSLVLVIKITLVIAASAVTRARDRL